MLQARKMPQGVLIFTSPLAPTPHGLATSNTFQLSLTQAGAFLPRELGEFNELPPPIVRLGTGKARDVGVNEAAQPAVAAQFMSECGDSDGKGHARAK
jgi:hypothetical protein